MSVKQLKKQLFLSIIAVLITFSSLSSATYAWYAMNTVVTASGMKISANTEGLNFEITNKVDADGKPEFVPGQTTATVQYTASTSLLPTHPQNLKALGTDLGGIADWYHTYSNQFDDAAVNADLTSAKWTNVNHDDLSKGYGYFWNENADGTKSTFAMAVQFYVRLNPDVTGPDVELTNIKAKNITITDSTGSNELSKSVYLLAAGKAGTYQISTSDVTTGEPVLGSVSSESGVLIDKVTPTKNGYGTIVILVFFDGQDADCKSSNYKPDNISISLEFEGTQVTKNA